MKKRLLSGLLALSMMFSLFPVSAFASENYTGGGVDLPDAATVQELDVENDATGNKIVKVSTEQEFLNAISNYEWAYVQTYEIILQNDIALHSKVTIKHSYSVPLIISGGYTITYEGAPLDDNWFTILTGIVNFGNPDGSSGVTLKNTVSPASNDASVIALSPSYAGKIAVNMYNCTIDGGSNGLRGVVLHKDSTHYSSNDSSASTIMNSTIQNCTSSDSGAGIYVGNGFPLTMTNSTVTNCISSNGYGGGIYIYTSSGDDCKVKITDSTISNCTSQGAVGRGGGIYSTGRSTYTLSNTNIYDCTAASGGGLYVNSDTVTLDNKTSITNCKATNGGGIFAIGSINLNECSVTNCEATYGGGICSSGGGINLNANSRVTGCKATYGGGVYGLYVYNNTSRTYAHLHAHDNGTLCNNTATNAGADIAMDSDYYFNVDLPDAKSMDQIYLADGKGRKIDGWYSDTEADRYKMTKHVDSVAANKTIGQYGNTATKYLVASYNVYDIEFAGSNTSYCKASDTISGTNEINVAYKDDTVYLTYSGTVDENTRMGWKAVTDDGTVVTIVPETDETPAHFSLPDKLYCKKVTITPVVEYKLNVTGGKAYAETDTELTTPISWAQADTTVKIVADAPAADDGAHPDALFANWTTANTENKSITAVNDSTDHETTFTMPAAPVSITAVNQYKVTVTGGTAYTTNADDAAALIYAKKDAEVHLTYTGPDTEDETLDSWSTSSEGIIDAVNGKTDKALTFTMPGNAVEISTVAKYGIHVTGGKAYSDTACSNSIAYAKAGDTVYLQYTGEDSFNHWSSEDVDPITRDADSPIPGKASFTMPDKAVTIKPDASKYYNITVTGGEAYDNDRYEGMPLTRAPENSTVYVKYTGTDTEDETLHSWASTSAPKADGKTDKTFSFTMPGNEVTITAVKKYKVTVVGGTASTDETTAAASIYAKENDTVHLTYTGKGPFKKWNWDESVITDGITGEEQASFTMPAHAVTITTTAGVTPMPVKYGILVQLPEGETFTEGSTPVTVTVTDTEPETPDDADAPSTQAADVSGLVFAKAGQTVTLKFDSTSLPEGSEKTFGEWKVVSIAPAQPDDTDDTDGTEDADTADNEDAASVVTAPVTVTKPTSMTEATFTMLASAVVVTFTLNAPSTPDEPADGSDSVIGGIVAGVAIGSATYLVGTDLWLNALYGFLPTNRIQLAEALWNRADCPAPQSTELYPDIDEDDTDAQQAARWCVEQGLIKDYRKTDNDGNEEVTFKPYRYVFRPQAIKAWYDLEALLNKQQ